MTDKKKTVHISIFSHETYIISLREDHDIHGVYQVVTGKRSYEIWTDDPNLFDCFEDKLSVVTNLKTLHPSSTFFELDESESNETFVLPDGFKTEPFIIGRPHCANRKQYVPERTMQTVAFLSQMTDKVVIKPKPFIDCDIHDGQSFNLDSLFLSCSAEDAASRFLDESNKAIIEYDKEYEIWKGSHHFESFQIMDKNQQYDTLFSFLCSFIQPWMERVREIDSIKREPLFSGYSSHSCAPVRQFLNFPNPFYAHLLDSISSVYDIGKDCHFMDTRLKKAYQEPQKLSLDDFSHLEKHILRDRTVISYGNQISPLITDCILFCTSNYTYKTGFDHHSFIDYLACKDSDAIFLCQKILDAIDSFSSFVNIDSRTESFIEQVKAILIENNYPHAIATNQSLKDKLLDWAQGPITRIDTFLDFYDELSDYGKTASYAIDNHNGLHALKICHAIYALSPIIDLVNNTFHDIIHEAEHSFLSFDTKSAFSVCKDFLTLCKSLGANCEVDALTAQVLKTEQWDYRPSNWSHSQTKRDMILKKFKRPDD